MIFKAMDITSFQPKQGIVPASTALRAFMFANILYLISFYCAQTFFVFALE